MNNRLNNLKLIKNFMLSKKETFTFDDIFAFMMENNIDEYALIWIIKEQLKEEFLIKESYDSEISKAIFIPNKKI